MEPYFEVKYRFTDQVEPAIREWAKAKCLNLGNGMHMGAGWSLHSHFVQSQLAELQAILGVTIEGTTPTSPAKILWPHLLCHLCRYTRPVSQLVARAELTTELARYNLPLDWLTRDDAAGFKAVQAEGGIAVRLGMDIINVLGIDTIQAVPEFCKKEWDAHLKVRQGNTLLENIQLKRQSLTTLLNDCEEMSVDPYYRWYHGSFKTYRIQEVTVAILTLLNSVAPQGVTLNQLLLSVVTPGTGQVFEFSHNRNWAAHTLPLWAAYFHARMALSCCQRCLQYKEVPDCLPSDLAALLSLFDLR